tara:strand:+ start:1490 stop:2095 length:606 start_codon:yes stop_codon:yes gene_type:complete
LKNIFNDKRSYSFYKRQFDIFFSILFLVIFIPILFFLILINLIILKSNPFFVEERAGIHGRPFKFIKIKTMLDNTDLDYENRIYRYGKYLRKYKIDELPQLINVLIGDMSLVGPRPLLLEYNANYNNFEIKRLSVIPGITGLAQVKVLNSADWKRKIKYDIFYVNNYNFNMDIHILIKTFKLLIKIFFFNTKIIESHERKK